MQPITEDASIARDRAEPPDAVEPDAPTVSAYDPHFGRPFDRSEGFFRLCERRRVGTPELRICPDPLDGASLRGTGMTEAA